MELSEFLVKAKKATYAGNATADVLEDDCKQLTYEEEGYRYRDRYYGSDPFAGQEVVFQDGRVIWSMVYRGETMNISNPEPIYEFLRKAMLQVREDRPFRGPNELVEGQLRYTDESEGGVSGFSGTEQIEMDGRLVYILRYSGGIVR